MAGTFTLTNITADHMGKDAMKKDSMAKDTVSKDAMAPTTLTVTSSSVDLSKHLAHKVSITGSPAARGKMDAMKKDAMAKDPMAKEASAFIVKSLRWLRRPAPSGFEAKPEERPLRPLFPCAAGTRATPTHRWRKSVARRRSPRSTYTHRLHRSPGSCPPPRRHPR